MDDVWVFNGKRGAFPSGVFTSREEAEAWIAHHRPSGMLTRYPLDVGVYDWPVSSGVFTPRRDDQRSAGFIGRFSSASQDHEHFEDGQPAGQNHG